MDVGVEGTGLGLVLVGVTDVADVGAVVVLGCVEAVTEAGAELAVGATTVGAVAVEATVAAATGAVGSSIAALLPPAPPVIAAMITPTSVITLAMPPMTWPMPILPTPGMCIDLTGNLLLRLHAA